MSVNFRFHVITRPFSSVTSIASRLDSSVAFNIESERVSSVLFLSRASLISINSCSVRRLATGTAFADWSATDLSNFSSLVFINFARESSQPYPCRRRISSNARKTSMRCFFSITRSVCSNSRRTVRCRAVLIGLQVLIFVVVKCSSGGVGKRCLAFGDFS
jgi:hypothetical protein